MEQKRIEPLPMKFEITSTNVYLDNQSRKEAFSKWILDRQLYQKSH